VESNQLSQGRQRGRACRQADDCFLTQGCPFAARDRLRARSRGTIKDGIQRLQSRRRF
jgi:hypothetical protein